MLRGQQGGDSRHTEEMRVGSRWVPGEEHSRQRAACTCASLRPEGSPCGRRKVSEREREEVRTGRGRSCRALWARGGLGLLP